MNRRPRRSALTLLEVLVAVAIISLLVAVLLPSLNAARAHTRRVSCAANLRQLAGAWSQYLDAHKGAFLRGVDVNLNYGGRQGLAAPFQGPKPLNRFLGLPLLAVTGTEVLRCPCDVGTGEVQPSFYEYIGTSYDTNPYLIGQDNFNIQKGDPCTSVLMQLRQRLPRLNRSMIRTEAQLLLMGDTGWFEAAHFHSELRLDWHGRRAWYNLAFLDTHVDFLRMRKGLLVTAGYTVLPFQDLQQAAAGLQQEVAGG